MINYQEHYNIINTNVKEDIEMDKLIDIIDYNNIYMNENEFNKILYLISSNDKRKLINYIKYMKLIISMHNLEF